MDGWLDCDVMRTSFDVKPNEIKQIICFITVLIRKTGHPIRLIKIFLFNQKK